MPDRSHYAAISDMQTRINYFLEPSQFANFFSVALQNKIGQIAESLDDHQEIMVFPDATLKTNLFPNGIACLSKAQEALLMPFLLSDPGCGYLLFSLEKTEKTVSNWQQLAGKLLDGVINRLEPSFQSVTQDEDKQLQQLIQSYDLTAEETEAIYADFLSVTNTIEIRQPLNYDASLMADQKLSADRFIGFIHGGSHSFPKILAKRFVYRIAEFADNKGFFTLDNIKEGIFGVSANSPLGQEYIHWLELAMQFADLNRHAVFTRIKLLLEKLFYLKVNLINDKRHAGLFNFNQNGANYFYSTRGAQSLFGNSQHSPSSPLTLLAGQRESLAALVIPNTNNTQTLALFPHGTSEFIRDDFDYAAQFSARELETYHQYASNCYYNSHARIDEHLPHNYNLLQSLKYFVDRNAIKIVTLLAPFINIQSERLKCLTH